MKKNVYFLLENGEAIEEECNQVKNEAKIFNEDQGYFNELAKAHLCEYEHHLIFRKIPIIKDKNVKAGKLIQSIQNIKFPNLIKLSLDGNQIRSIEGLQRVFLPNLE